MAKTLYRNGRIYTAAGDRPFADALVVEGDRILAVGDESATRSAAEGARVVDLAGRMVMPGVHDAHSHLMMSGLRANVQCRLTPFATPDQVVEELQEFYRERGPVYGDWIVGGEVYPPPEGVERLTRRQLDLAFPDTPIYLWDWGYHCALANTEALRRAGIGEDDEHGSRGIFLRDESGRLTGELIETATWRVLRAIPDPSREVCREVTQWALDVCHEFGITSVQEASANRLSLQALRDLEEAGELKSHVATHIVWRMDGLSMASADEMEALIEESDRWASRHVSTGFVKIFMDGGSLPPVPSHSDLTEDAEIDRTWIMHDHDELVEALRRFDAAGRRVKLHCAGDGSMRACIDAIERVRELNGPGQTHETAHTRLVHADDFPRMSALNIGAEMSPALWQVPEYGLGEFFHFSEVLRHGIRMTVGSDWILPPNPNLFPGIQGMVQHKTHAVGLADALAAVTRVGAEAVGHGAERGTLEPGKLADYIILDRDLFAVDADEIGSVVVLETVVEGESVFRKE